MQGEGYSDPVKRRRQERVDKGNKNIGKAFMPSQGEKERSGAGNHYGTFGGPVDALRYFEIFWVGLYFVCNTNMFVNISRYTL